VTVIWVLLIGCWLAIAAERSFKHHRAKNAKERAFIAGSVAEALEIKRQRDAESRAKNPSRLT